MDVNVIDTEYMSEHFMMEYVKDAVAQFVINRESGSEIKPKKFFKEYFVSVQQGTHVLFRGFKYVSATPYNRLCVLKAVIKVFKPFFRLNDRYDAADIHSLLMLMVPDFPLKVVEDAFTAYDNRKKDETKSLLFLDWINALKESFCTGPFDYEATIILKQIEAKIDEYSNTPAEGAVGGINPGEESFVNAEYDSMPLPWNARDTIDCAVFNRILTLKCSSNEDVSAKLSESKGAKTKKKVGKRGAKAKKKAADKAKGKPPNKQLPLGPCPLEKCKKAKPRNASMPAPTTRATSTTKPAPTLGAVAKKPKGTMPYYGKPSRRSSETRKASELGAGAEKGADGQSQPRGRPIKRQNPRTYDNAFVYDPGMGLGRRRSLSGVSNASSSSRRPWR